MKLEPKIANTIVDSLKDIIHYEINLFDTTGTIIASTDAKRVGTFHDGALKVVKQRQPVVITSDDEFHGARRGTNLPILFNESVVGVIGITGAPEDVAPLGNIIKKMTEILIRENWSQMTRYNRQNNFDTLVGQLITREHDHSLINYLMTVLEVDADCPRRVLVGRFIPTTDAHPSFSELAELLPKYLAKYPNSFYAIANSQLCLILEDGPTHTDSRLLSGIQAEVQQNFEQPFTIGIGRTVTNIDDYWLSYQDAAAVASWQQFTNKAAIRKYSDLDIELVLAAIPQDRASDFLHSVLQKIPQAELGEFKQVLNAYVNNNGSIIHGAAELFIHKNTFQNKLNRIHSVTGYNPRELKDFVVLYLAFLLDDYQGFIKAK
ncbi:CdaR family transcriptional regulator [Lacticaseibacillus baoqingensis]|uniref:CdaR family transcriptional regulator n=1 Tax=Lacticaseibacillus baoqingensis TaxID=2486013 RepID=A0ABW4E2E2_9LACO|nr:sugar diacid recognition domain-containing protein [Lacticaseibacillus baoqingensis]